METSEGDTSTNVVHSQAGSIRCVSVRQLLEATQIHSSSAFRIDGNELDKFILVANLCFLTATTGFELDDGTGRIKAYLSDAKSDAQDNMLEAHDFPYLRITGELSQYKGKNSIKATDIRKASSPYEPYYHILHTIRDTLAYEREPPSRAAVVENEDPRSHARDDTAREGPQADTVPELDVQVASPPASIAGSYAREVPTQSVNERGYNGKAPMSGEESPTPLPTTSNTPPISPTRRSRVKDAGISEHGGTSHHGDRMTPVSPGRDTASEMQHGSSPPSPSPVPAVAHTRRFTPNDPYSNLTLLQRDVLLYLESEAAQVSTTSSLYPTSKRSPPWTGVHVSTILRWVRRRRSVPFDEFKECMKGLVEGDYIFNPVDDVHYRCT